MSLEGQSTHAIKTGLVVAVLAAKVQWLVFGEVLLVLELILVSFMRHEKGCSELMVGLKGGSIRVPSAFNFLYGIRPSHGRMPYAKMANSMEGQETVHSVVGPIAHSAGGLFSGPSIREASGADRPDLRLFLTSVLGEEPWKYDSKVIPLPWRTAEEEAVRSKIQSGGLNLGFYSCDGVVCPPSNLPQDRSQG